MNSFVQKPAAQADHTLTDIQSADTRQLTQRPLLIAGTSQGLLFLNTEQDIELEGYSISALASSSNGLWVITDYNSVWHRSSNNHSCWDHVASVNDLQLNCILPIQDGALIGTSGACLIRVVRRNNIQHVNCFESVEGREEWYTPWGDPPDVRSMAVDQSGDLYVNVHVGGILYSSDQGESWSPTIDFHADVHEVRTVPNYPTMVLAATAQGLAVSRDKGKNWSFERTNLHAAYSRAIAVCNNTILMTASTGPRTNKSAVYRCLLDQPGRFQKCEQGLPEWFSDNIDTGTLDTWGDFAAFGTRNGQIFLSSDAGLTWQQIATGLDPISCLIVVEELAKGSQ